MIFYYIFNNKNYITSIYNLFFLSFKSLILFETIVFLNIEFFSYLKKNSWKFFKNI